MLCLFPEVEDEREAGGVAGGGGFCGRLPFPLSFSVNVDQQGRNQILGFEIFFISLFFSGLKGS